MSKLRANLRGIIGPRNIGGITTFAKFSSANARLVADQTSGLPFSYILQFDYFKQHQIYLDEKLYVILYDYGGTNLIAHYNDPPYHFICRSAIRPEDKWVIHGQDVLFRLKEQRDQLLIYEASC